MPAYAEIIIEGEVVPNARAAEGPHGESTGFYGENKEAFLIRVKCITHRKNPVSYGLICRVFEDYPRTLLRSGSFQTLLIQKTGMSNITKTYLPEIWKTGHGHHIRKDTRCRGAQANHESGLGERRGEMGDRGR